MKEFCFLQASLVLLEGVGLGRLAYLSEPHSPWREEILPVPASQVRTRTLEAWRTCLAGSKACTQVCCISITQDDYDPLARDSGVLKTEQ